MNARFAVIALLFAASASSDEILVATRHPIAPIISSVGSVAHKDSALPVYLVTLRKGVSVMDALVRLSQDFRVLWAEPNLPVRLGATPNDPCFATAADVCSGKHQWAPQKIEADKAWGIWQPHVEVRLAVVDSGVDHEHSDLTHKILRSDGSILGYDALVGHRSDAGDSGGHGTMVAGIAAAEINNATGIAGVAGWRGVGPDRNVKIMPIKAGVGEVMWTYGVARGVTWARNHQAGVMNMSLTLGSFADIMDFPFTETVRDAVEHAWADDCVLVGVAGNGGSSHHTSPADFYGVISVASSDGNDRLLSDSNYGSWVDIAAPGETILTTKRGGGYITTESGTSLAAPHVSGAAALIRAQNPNLNNDFITEVLKTTADPLNPDQPHSIGGGRLNVYRALKEAGSPTLSVAVAPDNVDLPGLPAPHGTVTLSTPAGSGGETVALSTLSPEAVELPPTVQVPANHSTATFKITILGMPLHHHKVTIVARRDDGGVATATLWVWPTLYHIRDMFADRRTLVWGKEIATQIVVDHLPHTDIAVSLSSSRPDVVHVPPTTLVAALHDSKVLVFRPNAVTQPTEVTLTASIGGSSRQITFTVTPP